MLALTVDSSTEVPQALVACDGRPIGQSASAGRALERLHEAIGLALQSARIELSDLDRVAAIVGPGSWTGLHVGLTTAKTIAQTLDLPLVPISMLDALAWTHVGHEGTIVTMVDARRGMAYAGAYASSDGAVRALIAPCRLEASKLDSELDVPKRDRLLVGSGVAAYVQAGGRRGARVSPYVSAHPEAITRLACAAGGEVTGDARFDIEPLYLSDDATRLKPYAVAR